MLYCFDFGVMSYCSKDKVNTVKKDMGGDLEMADAPSEGGDKKRSWKKQATGSEEVSMNEAGKDLAKPGDSRQKKLDSIDVNRQMQASHASRKKREVPKKSKKSRDRVKERENRKNNDIMAKAHSQLLSELRKLLLQGTPKDLEDDIITDFVDAMSIFSLQTKSLNSKEFCLVCGSSPNKEEVLYCRDCGNCFHTYCAIDTRARRIPKEKRHLWRCRACRICEVCNGEENWENMLCCDGCDRGFHTYCLKPAMKKIPNDGWKCNDCVHCVSCGAKHSGTRKDIWKRDCTLCITCFQLYEKKADCPICKVVWPQEENDAKAVCCDTCNKLVHPACSGIDDAKYRAIQEEEPGEWNCPKCTGDLEVSDEEENDKKYLLPSQHRIIEAHKQFGHFCRDRLKRLERTCGVIEHVYQSHLTSDNSCKAAAPSGFDSVDNQSAAEAGHTIAPVSADTMATCLQASSQAGDVEPPPKTDSMRSNAASAWGCIDVQPRAVHALAPPSPDAGEHLAAKQDVWIMESHIAIPADSQFGKRDDGAKEVSNNSLEMLHQMHENSEGTSVKDVAASRQNPAAEELGVSTLEPHAQSAIDEVMTEASAPGNLALWEGAGHLSIEQLLESQAGMQSEEDGGLARTKEAAAVKKEEEQVEAGVKASSDASTIETIQVCEFEEAARNISAGERAEKLSGLASLKQNLVKLEKSIDKHKFKDFVPFFDDVIRMLHDPDLLSAIPKEVKRVSAQALEDVPDAAERSLRVREPQIVSSEWHLSKQPQLAVTSSAIFLQEMLPHMDTFELEHDLHAHQHPTGRVAASCKRKYVVPKNLAPGARGGFSAGAVGGAQGRVALHGTEVLILMSQFYTRIDPLVRQNPETYGRLYKHFYEANWRALKLEQLIHFVEETFRQTLFIVQCFYDVFRDYLENGDEEMVEEAPPVAVKLVMPLHWLPETFCFEVRRIYGVASPIYRDFIQTMNAHKGKDTRWIISTIKQLFSDNPTLIVEFAHFVPEPFKSYCTVDTPKKTVVDTRPAGSANLAHMLAASLASSSFSPASAAGQAPLWSGGAQQQQQLGRKVLGASPFNFDDGLLLEQRFKQQQQRQLNANLQLIQQIGREAKKRKVTDSASIGASDPAHGNSQAAMSHQNQQQTQQQQQQVGITMRKRTLIHTDCETCQLALNPLTNYNILNSTSTSRSSMYV